MSEVLSQKEIDRVLSGINSGEIKEDNISEALAHKEIYEYDFRRPTRVSKDQLRIIRTLHENFAETFGFFLSSRLQTMATIDMLAVDQLRYSEYALSIANPCVVYIFDIEQTEGRAVIELTPDLVFMVVERLLGGSGGEPAEPRAITAIEQRIIAPILKKALLNLAASWKPVHELGLKLVGFESNSDFVQIAPASEIVLVISFEIRIGEETFLMNLSYPYFALEDIIAKLSVQLYNTNLFNKKKDMAFYKINKQLQNTSMEIKAELGKAQLSIKELAELEEGDILYVNNSIDADIPIYVQNRLKYYGRPGTTEGRLAVKISRELEKERTEGELNNGRRKSE